MLITLIVIGALGASAAAGGGLLHRRRAKRLDREERKRGEIDFKTMLQDAGFIIGAWNGWDVKDGYFFTTMAGMKLAWRTLDGQRIAWSLDGKSCSACGWRIWRLCRPYEADGSKWLGHIGAVCPNAGCGRLFKDGDRVSPLAAVFNREHDMPSVMDVLRRLHEAESEPVYLEALKRETARIEGRAAPKALPAPTPEKGNGPPDDPKEEKPIDGP